MKVYPLPGEPILVIEPGPVLVIADLHIGLEAGLRKAGMHLPSQTSEKAKRILKAIRGTRAKRLVLLGDVKHTIGRFSYQEEDEVPDLFKRLLSKVRELDVVIGNHDGGLKDLVPGSVPMHQDLVIGTVGLTHGHSWPSEEVMACDHIIMGHNHPTIIFVDELGQRSIHPCWVRTGLDHERAKKRYKDPCTRATGIVMPAFDDLGRGTPFNLQGAKLLGPLLTNRVLRLEQAEVHLLDGTFLGQLKDLEVVDRKLQHEQDGRPSGPAGEGGGGQ